MKYYKSLKAGLKSEAHNDKQFQFEVGKWYHQDGKIVVCDNGFHASKNIIDAMRYVDCEILAEVEMRGQKDLSENDKVCYSDIKINKAYLWTKEASVKLAIFAAEQVIDIYEKEYPNDNRPREAIEAAKNWLANPTKSNRAAAEAAARAAWAAWSAAWAAEAAWAAARAAARAAAEAAARAAEAAEAAARAAAEAAWAAARATARAAEAAAEAARATARATAEAADKVLAKCHNYIIKEIIPTLKEYKE